MPVVTFTPGTRLGPYEILSARDLPGLGEVYDARDHDQQRNIAFRVLRADFAASPDRVRRFEQDAYAAVQLAHPNILTVHDVGTDAQAAYVASEPMEGRTLREVLDGGALPTGTAIPYAVQVAQGLAAAHEKGIVHQDLKPENVLIGSDGSVKIVGFGLAAATQSESAPGRGVPLGEPGYVSPEQVRGDPVDQGSDMFAFGAIFYEMLTGTRAFTGSTPLDTMTAVLQSNPPMPSASDLPPVVTRIVELSLKKSPGSRLSAGDAMIGLQGFWSQPVAPDTGEAPERPRNTGRFVRSAVALGAIALAALVGPWLLRVARPARTPAPTAPASSTSAPSSTPTPPAATPPAATPPPAPPPAAAPVPTPPPAPPPATAPVPTPPPPGPAARTPSAPARAATGP